MRKPKQPTVRSRPAGKTKKRDYLVRVTNVRAGTQEDLSVPIAALGRDYSLWPIFTVYIVGFGLLGVSFIALTLRLVLVFWVFLFASAVLVIGTATVRSYRRRS